MKLFFISTERGWHGGEEQLRLIVAGATALGHECQIAARAGGLFANRLQAAGFPVLELPRRVRSVRSIWRVRRALQRFRPDVIHANDSHAVLLQWTATWGLSCPARIAARRVLFPIRSTRRYRKGCDRIFCVSHAVARVCRESGLESEMLTVVHEGTDPARVQTGDARRGRAALGAKDDVPIILCVAQLAEYKGHRYLLDAMPTVLAAHPRAILVLAGDGPLREPLIAQARGLGLDAAVRFLGYRNDVPDLLQACNVFVLASPEEGLGTSVLDAIFAERPVVGTEAGGIPEMLRNDAGELCGWLVPARNSRALGEALLECLASPAEQARRIGLARTWAEAEFTAPTMVRRTLEEYASVLSSRGGGVVGRVAR